MKIDKFFTPKSVAVIGASREAGKIGNTILQNLISGGFAGEIYPVNPNAVEILGKKCYPNINSVAAETDLAVICVPAPVVLSAAKDVIKKKVGAVIVVSSGFKEIGNIAAEKKLAALFMKAKIPLIGPNCLGVFDAHTKVDTLFLPVARLERPNKGKISFISQSGALGSAMLDLASAAGLGFAKFVSYGNASGINENDLLEYLSKDNQTGVICFYVEGLADGKRFMKTVSKISKPIIVLKGGRSAEGKKAALSHTGSIAGESKIYSGAFKQAGAVEVDGLEEMFAAAHVFEKLSVKPRGRRVQIITNGGGHGIVSADAVAVNNLPFAVLSEKTTAVLKKELPSICSIANPLDIVGDATAERFLLSISACQSDKNVDALVVNLLPQTPTVDHEKIVQKLKQMNASKPIVLVITGGKYAVEVARKYENAGFPVFQYPEIAVKALAAYLKHNR
ncbi:MAG: CoA-binding protein [Candidatus Aenigmarchaeota archaeon]|nr:CoA-binding protein [Candidatus Aenigmarchaeota archaeon]